MQMKDDKNTKFVSSNYRQTSNIKRNLVGKKMLITQMELEHCLSALEWRQSVGIKLNKCY